MERKCKKSELGTRLMEGRGDLHVWNVDDNGKIHDQVFREEYDRSAQFWLDTTDYELVYKEWRSRTPYIKLQLKNRLKELGEWEKDKLVSFIRTYHAQNCDAYAVAKNILFGWKIRVGSLGLKSNRTDEIVWEYGNGKITPDKATRYNQAGEWRQPKRTNKRGGGGGGVVRGWSGHNSNF